MRQLLNGAEVLLFRKSQVLGKTRLEKLAHYVAILLALVILISVILGNSLLFFHISSIDQFLNFLYGYLKLNIKDLQILCANEPNKPKPYCVTVKDFYIMPVTLIPAALED